MLTELSNVRQIPGEPRRRWFSDRDFDLIVWFDKDDVIIAFQLCYDKQKNEHALTWRAPSGYYHNRVDTGEYHPLQPKATPILVSDGVFDYLRIAEAFGQAKSEIEPRIADFVYEKLLEFGTPKGGGPTSRSG